MVSLSPDSEDDATAGGGRGAAVAQPSGLDSDYSPYDDDHDHHMLGPLGGVTAAAPPPTGKAAAVASQVEQQQSKPAPTSVNRTPAPGGKPHLKLPDKHQRKSATPADMGTKPWGSGVHKLGGTHKAKAGLQSGDIRKMFGKQTGGLKLAPLTSKINQGASGVKQEVAVSGHPHSSHGIPGKENDAV